MDRRPTIAVDHRRITSGDTAFTADRGAGIDVATVEHDVQGLIHGQPVVGNTHRSSSIQTKRATVTELLSAAVVPDVVLGLDAIQILQGDPKPQGGRHIIIGNPDLFALEVRQTGDARKPH